MTPKPRNLILNLLLAADGEPMSARGAVAACALFGIRENSVRVTLVRLAAAGLVEAAARGAYRLGPNAAGLAADIATWRTAEQRVRASFGEEWNGDWLAVHVGSLGRSNRVVLRARDRALALLGLRELDRGLYIRPDNLVGGVTAVRERLHKLGLDADAAVFIARDFDADREARARALWDGKALTTSYRTTRKKLEYWLARADTLEPEVAARESFLLGNAAIRQLVFDPLLPAPLVDVDERHAFINAVLRYDAAGHDIWKKLHLLPPRSSDAIATTAAMH